MSRSIHTGVPPKNRERKNGNIGIKPGIDYEPFGKPLFATPERLTFIGKEKDSESDLGDFGVRKYDDDIGRFLSVDPLWEKFRGWSPYHYSYNNPVRFKDPKGDSSWVAARGVSGTLGTYVHTFVIVKNEKTNETSTYSFYNKDGKLFGEKNWKNDSELKDKDLKSKTPINPPDGKGNQEFEATIEKEFQFVKDNYSSTNYAKFPNKENCTSEGNCNSATTGLLLRSGVALESIRLINPVGGNPGLGMLGNFGSIPSNGDGITTPRHQEDNP